MRNGGTCRKTSLPGTGGLRVRGRCCAPTNYFISFSTLSLSWAPGVQLILEYKHKPPRPISHLSLSPSRPLTQFGPSRFLSPSNIPFSFSFISLRAGPRHLAYPLNTNYTFSCKQDFLFFLRLLTAFFFCFPAERHPVGCYLKQPKYNLVYIKSTIEKEEKRNRRK